MGFFFAKAAPSGPIKAARELKSGGGGGTSGNKQQAMALARLGCAACPLNKADIGTPKMVATIKKGAEVYFMAEAPGRHEDEESGRPLTGPSGRLLRDCIPKDQICSFDNIVNCRPPNNRTPVWQEVQCCSPRRIKFIEEAKPRLIVGLGVVPLRAILNSADMDGMRGRFFAVKFGNHKCWFLPTHHPADVLEKAWKKNKPLNSMMGHCFRMDLRRAFDALEWLETPYTPTEQELRKGIQTFDGSKAADFEQVIDLLDQAKEAEEKAFDIETKGLRPYKVDAAIMSAAFSFNNTNFSFALDHPKSAFSKSQKVKIKAALKEVLIDGHTKIAHNVPFEVEWSIDEYGPEIARHHEWHCTQMEAHFLDERRGKAKSTDESERRAAYQALDFLCKQHFGISYKSLFKLNKKDMSKSDLGETLIYNAVDTKVTLWLHKAQKRLLKLHGLWEAYLEARPRQTSAALMQYFGVPIDQKEVKRVQKKLEREINGDTATGAIGLRQQIADLSVVKAYVKDHGAFNPASGDDTIAIFRDYLKRTEIIVEQPAHEAHNFNKSSESKKRYDTKGPPKYSVDKNVLGQIDHPLANLIVQLRNRTKLKSTYADDFVLGVGQSVYPDGYIHCNFSFTFAETGRGSSDSPNQQNWPQRNDAWVRNQVAAPDGYTLLAFDYGQLEGCTAAMCSKDKVLVKALWEDYDIHEEWAIKTAHKYPRIIGGKEFITDKAAIKKLRSKIKNKLVFPAIFGAQNSSIAGYLDMPEEIIEDLMDEFWETFSGLANWQNKLMERYYDVGYVESPTGRQTPLPHDPQSGHQ